MIWRILRAFPKLFIAFVVIVSSLAILFIWEVRRAAKEAAARAHSGQVEDTRAKEALVESKIDHLLLVDNDLYDLDSGAVIFKGWLKDGSPLKLFWQADTKKFLAQYQGVFVRYGLNGNEDGRLAEKNPLAFSDDYKWVVFGRDKDIWRADVDWKALKLVNERKVTSIEQFHERNLAGNIVVGTDKTLVVRDMMKLLRVDLETGDVKPVRIPLTDIAKRRSPDSKSVVGLEGGQFYCYDVDSDDAKAIPVGRGAINDYQWLGNDKCVAIAAMKTVIQYDRKNRSLTVVTALPSPCVKIGEPSPDGRFVFCVGLAKGVLVDLEKKTATPIIGGEGVCWVSNDTFAFSREVPDSKLRGAWLQTVGENERRISAEPYLVRSSGPMLVASPAGMIIYATKHGLSKMKPVGTDVAEVTKLAQPPLSVVGIQKWKSD